jgi:hypothetical protein
MMLENNNEKRHTQKMLHVKLSCNEILSRSKHFSRKQTIQLTYNNVDLIMDDSTTYMWAILPTLLKTLYCLHFQNKGTTK